MAVTSTSRAVASVGDLLLDELAEHDRDAALHGLEGLAGEPLVHLAQPPAERDHEARGDLRVFAHQAAHVGAEHADDARRLDRLDRRRAPLVLEHRELAEDVARAERRERDRAPVAVRAHRARVPLAHDVAGVARVALAEHRLPRLELARHRDLGDALQIGGLERRERGDATQQLDYLS